MSNKKECKVWVARTPTYRSWKKVPCDKVLPTDELVSDEDLLPARTRSLSEALNLPGKIVSGLYHAAAQGLGLESSELAQSRLRICQTCELFTGTNCYRGEDKRIAHVETGEMVLGCGCALALKLAIPDLKPEDACPAGKWK